MAFLFVEPIGLEVESDEKTGELTLFRLRLKELQPRSFNLNLLKHQARFTFDELQAYIDAQQPLMMPINEGKLRDGTTFFQLLEGDVIPVDRNFALKKQQAEEQKRLIEEQKQQAEEQKRRIEEQKRRAEEQKQHAQNKV